MSVGEGWLSDEEKAEFFGLSFSLLESVMRPGVATRTSEQAAEGHE